MDDLIRDALSILEEAVPLADMQSAGLPIPRLSDAKRLLEEARARAEGEGVLLPPEAEAATAAADHFWDVFEDIETTDGIAGNGPGADAAFRHMVRALVKKRWKAAKNGPMGVVVWRKPDEDD